MSRTRSYLAGTFFAYLNQFATSILAFWATPFLLHRLGQIDYGIWLLAQQVSGYMLLIDFGIVALLPREVAALSGKQLAAAQAGSVDTYRADLLSLLRTTGKVVLLQTLLVALCSAGVLYFGSYPLAAKQALLFVLVSLTLSFPLRLFPEVLMGLQDFAFLGRVKLASFSIGLGISVLLVWLGWRIEALATGWAFTQVSYLVAAAWRFRHLVPWVQITSVYGGWAELRPSHFLRGTWLSVGQLAQLLNSGADLLLVGARLGPATVVVYSCTQKLFTVLGNQPQAIVLSALPGLSQLRHSQSLERTREVSMLLSQAMLFFSGTLACSVVAMNAYLVKIWVGLEQYGGNLLSCLFAANLLLRHLDLAFGQVLFVFQEERRTSIKILLDGLFSMGLAWLLAPHYGMEGIAVAALSGSIVISLPVNLYLLSKHLKQSVVQLLLPHAPWFLGTGAIAAGAAYFAPQAATTGLLENLLYTTAVVFLYWLTQLPFLWNSPLRAYVLSLLQRK